MQSLVVDSDVNLECRIATEQQEWAEEKDVGAIKPFEEQAVVFL